MSEGQGLSVLLECLFKFEENPFKTNKVIATYSKISKIQAKFSHKNINVIYE
jgi:hypothetical protein